MGEIIWFDIIFVRHSIGIYVYGLTDKFPQFCYYQWVNLTDYNFFPWISSSFANHRRTEVRKKRPPSDKNKSKANGDLPRDSRFDMKLTKLAYFDQKWIKFGWNIIKNDSLHQFFMILYKNDEKYAKYMGCKGSYEQKP